MFGGSVAFDAFSTAELTLMQNVGIDELTDWTVFGTRVGSDLFIVNDVRICQFISFAALTVGQFGLSASRTAQMTGGAFVIVNFLVKAGFTVLHTNSAFQKDFAAEISQTAGKTLFGGFFTGFTVGITNEAFIGFIDFELSVGTRV